jgi:hypothetical protein
MQLYKTDTVGMCENRSRVVERGLRYRRALMEGEVGVVEMNDRESGVFLLGFQFFLCLFWRFLKGEGRRTKRSTKYSYFIRSC